MVKNGKVETQLPGHVFFRVGPIWSERLLVWPDQYFQDQNSGDRPLLKLENVERKSDTNEKH